MVGFQMVGFQMVGFHVEGFQMVGFHMGHLLYCRSPKYYWSQHFRVLCACKLYNSCDYLYGSGLYGSCMRMLGWLMI